MGVLQPRVHSFSVGTVHTVRDDFFCGLSVFSLEVPGDMDWRGKTRKLNKCDIKDIYA